MLRLLWCISFFLMGWGAHTFWRSFPSRGALIFMLGVSLWGIAEIIRYGRAA